MVMADNGCCMEWEQEIVLYHDNELSPESCLRVEKHLRKCSRCSEYYTALAREERFMAGRLRHQFAAPLSNRAFTDQVMRRLPAQPLSASERAMEWAKEYAEWMFASGRRSVALAMTLLICALGAYWAVQVGLHIEETTLNIQRNGAIFRTTLLEPLSSTFETGEYFELPDGSILYATQGTWFQIESFPNHDEERSDIEEERRIKLVLGELFIDVQSRRETFSVVIENNAKITVHGTQFYVATDRYSNVIQTKVAVREGRVNIEKMRNQLGATYIHSEEMTSVNTINGSIQLQFPETIDPLLLERLDLFDEQKDNPSMRWEAPLPLPVKESPIYEDGELLRQIQSYTPPHTAEDGEVMRQLQSDSMLQSATDDFAVENQFFDDKPWRILD